MSLNNRELQVHKFFYIYETIKIEKNNKTLFQKA